MTSDAEGKITEDVLADIFTERCRIRDQEYYHAEDEDEEVHGQLAIWAATTALQALPLWQTPESIRDRRTEMVKAAAMLVIEIERLDRIIAREGDSEAANG